MWRCAASFDVCVVQRRCVQDFVSGREEEGDRVESTGATCNGQHALSLVSLGVGQWRLVEGSHPGRMELESDLIPIHSLSIPVGDFNRVRDSKTVRGAATQRSEWIIPRAGPRDAGSESTAPRQHWIAAGVKRGLGSSILELWRMG